MHVAKVSAASLQNGRVPRSYNDAILGRSRSRTPVNAESSCGFDVVESTSSRRIVAQLASDGYRATCSGSLSQVRFSIKYSDSIPIDRCNFCVAQPIFVKFDAATRKVVPVAGNVSVHRMHGMMSAISGYSKWVAESDIIFLAFKKVPHGTFNCPRPAHCVQCEASEILKLRPPQGGAPKRPMLSWKAAALSWAVVSSRIALAAAY